MTYTVDDEFIEKVTNQFRLWAMFLNNGVGLLSFTLGLASLGTPLPYVSAILSFFVITFTWYQGQKFFPEEINQLRKSAKNDEKALVILKGLESRFFSFPAMLRNYPMYLLGFFFLLSVACSPLFVKLLPITKSFYLSVL